MKGNRNIVALSLLLISGSKYSEAIELQNSHSHHHSQNYGSMRRLDGSLIDIEDEETPDGVALATAEDMYAFSSISAAGGSVTKTVADLEKFVKADEQSDKKQRDADLAKAKEVADMASEEAQFTRKYLNSKEFKQKQEEKKKAIIELEQLSTNDATSAFAALQAAEEIERKAENMTGSGGAEDPAIKKAKMKEQQQKDKEAFKKKQEIKKALIEKKKKEKQDKIDKINNSYKKLQKEYGGLKGTEDTGYDDSLMAMYIKTPLSEPALLQTTDIDDLASKEYLLTQHRERVLADNIVLDLES